MDQGRPRRSFAEPEGEDEGPQLEKRRRNSFNKMQQQLGDESQDAAEVVASQVGAVFVDVVACARTTINLPVQSQRSCSALYSL